MLKKLISLVVSLGIICSLVVLPTGTAYAAEGTQLSYGVLDDQGRIHIQTAEHLRALAQESSQMGNPVNTQYQIFILDNDITLNDTYDEAINIAPNEKDPFRGTFDGNGHTISGLRFSTHLIGTGLFKYTDSATIKNLNIYDANINATYCGGIVAGIAKNTKFINISIQDSYLTCIPGNVSIAVFTDAGMSVGALAGQAVNGSLIYNCESVNTSLNASEVVGGTALGGSGAYFGGLVGSLVGSHVEYSRTISEGNVNKGNITYTTTAILEVANGAYIYTGGICGELKAGASVIDSFSNISMHNQYDTSAVLGLLSFSYGFVGGIAGAMYGPETSVERCQYSGYSEAWDYIIIAEILGIPIGGADNNKHLGGIIGKIENAYHEDIDDRVKNCYYNSDRMMEHKGGAAKSAVAWRNPSASIYYSLTPNTCDSYSEEEYKDQTSSWANNGFDFNGTVMRETPCSVLFGGEGANHANKWVMDTYNYDRNITDELTTSFTKTTMPIHDTTNIKIYSNYHNAFTDENADSMTYEYTINADQTVNVPNSNSVSALVAEENTDYAGYIGLAFVSRNTTQQGTSYNCDYIYANDETITNTVPLNIIQIYSSDPDKRIYAVWCQGKTIGGQLNLSGGSGIRVLTAVNTKLLENIALDKPDDEYGRAVTFNNDPNTKYLIKADSRAWLGEQYVKAAGASAAKAEIPNAQVFSIYLSLDENDYNTEINAVGDILLNDSSAEGKFIDYICGGSFKRSATEIAEAYFNDLMAGDYQISDDAYINLINYIPEIANEEIDMSSDMDFDQFDDVLPEAEAQADAE